MTMSKKNILDEERIRKATDVICEELDGMTLPEAVVALGNALTTMTALASYEVDEEALYGFIDDSMDKIKMIIRSEISTLAKLNSSEKNLN